MFVVRPVQTSDMPALEALALEASGVHTLPRTTRTMAQAIERSLASFASHPRGPGEESYVFVMESVEDRAVVGVAAIAATAGSSGTFFAFRNDVIQQVSRDLGISHSVQVLTLCSDLTLHSQLSGFRLRAPLQAGSEAQLLSRARLLFAAVAPRRFCDRFFASMSGIADADGHSPFWNALGRKFFQMDFLAAERMIEGARNRTLIVELMPPYPVYVPLLPDDAQAAMGQVHAQGELPFRILSDEGFAPDNYIDIFDGGPILQARKSMLRSFSQTMRRCVTSRAEGGATGSYLVATAGEDNFRALVAECTVPAWSDSVMLPPDAMRCLDVVPGDAVLCIKVGR